MIREYATWEVDELVRYVETQPGFLVGRFFNRVKSFQTESIEFDIIDKGRRIAPFVSPFVQGRVMRDEGYRTMQFKPAYIKLADLIRPQDTFTRRQGEPYGGNLTPQARMDRMLADVIERHQLGIDLRKEWMAAQALVYGSVTIAGESYPTSVVDFGRDAALSVTLSGGARWNQTTADIVTDIENMASLVRRKSRGTIVSDIIMNGVTWSYMRARIKDDLILKKLFDTQLNVAPTSTVDIGPRNGNTDAEQVGSLSGRFKIWVYDGFYNDENFGEVAFIPDNKVIFISNAGVEGTQYQGAIMDVEANMEPRDVFTKTKMEFDPSALRVLTQSAPLVAPRRANASGVLTVA